MDGYAKVARLMANHHEMAIFRGFEALAFQNLLYLQAELVYLQDEHQEVAKADKKSGHPTKSVYEKDWRQLRQSRADGSEQWQKVLEIRAKLREYYEFLKYQKLICDLQKPVKPNLEFFRDWLKRKRMGGWPLVGSDRDVWDEATQHDLVTLIDQRDVDCLTGWICKVALPKFHATLGRHFKKPLDWDPESGISEYSNSRIKVVVDILGTLLSSLFSLLSIVTLYCISSMPVRLGVVAAFTTVFAIALALLTTARRVEIFAATSAFAAVQVVFVGTNGGKGVPT